MQNQSSIAEPHSNDKVSSSTNLSKVGWIEFLTRKSTVALFIFIFALIPRVMPLHHVTIDEGMWWADRSENFLDGLQTGNFRQTAQAIHPGVGTMWMGVAGILIDNTLNGEDHREIDNIQYRVNIRIVMQIVNATCVAVGYLLLTRLIDLRVAFLSALLWAGEPFIIALSTILHVDGLSTSMMVLSFLSGLIAFHGSSKSRWYWWIASAILGGIAGMTKFTTLSVIGILFCVLWMTKYVKLKQIHYFIIWGLVSLVTIMIFYPATWGNMDAVVAKLTRGVDIAFGGHNNFFLGNISSDVGPLYYPVSVLVRITPWLLIGLILSPFALRKQTSPQQKQLVFSFFFFVIIFSGLMLVQSKRLDRYLLPIYPILCVFSAYGLNWLFKRFNWLWVTILLASVIIVNFLIIYPYPLAYYNPLTGGGYLADEIIMVGWGEGHDQVAEYIESQEDHVCDLEIISQYDNVLKLYLPCAQIVTFLEWPLHIESADYFVFYIADNQRTGDPQLEAYFADREPEHTVTINNIDYAYVYKLDASNP